MSKDTLDIFKIEDIKGRLRVPAYQRGYRWERRQVEQLLDDIIAADANSPYYLQPVVVAPVSPHEKNADFDYDLIDGQQRLTTLFIIMKALERAKTYSIEDFTAEATNVGSDSDTTTATGKLLLATELKDVDTRLNYELSYETREDTRLFLENLLKHNPGEDKDRKLIVSSPDHLYIWHAFNVVNEWIATNEKDTVKKMANAVIRNIRIIWYVLPDSVPNWKKFRDLNSGKIPLTNSELIKALFLSKDNNDESLDEPKQNVIVSEWDSMERELRDKRFWSFLTKNSQTDYSTKIDLFFDILSGKSSIDKKDKFFTFREFAKWFHDRLDEGKKGKDNWEEIHSIFRRLHDWYKKTEFYHKIGYLVAIQDENELREILRIAYPSLPSTTGALTHSEFKEKLEERIGESMIIPKQIGSFKNLDYKGGALHEKWIHRVLTLYNILLTDKLASQGVRYPFHIHHDKGSGGWSLEHVHAQNSDELNRAEQWKLWAADQLESLQRLEKTLEVQVENFDKERYKKLKERLEKFRVRPTNREDFKQLTTDYADIINFAAQYNGKKYGMHSIANLALLSKNDNSMLNKSTFDVKRTKVSEKSSTNFVPIGTERVFMKAISGTVNDKDGNPVTDSDGNPVRYSCDSSHAFYWGDPDRDAYITDIEQTLLKYLGTEEEKSE